MSSMNEEVEIRTAEAQDLEAVYRLIKAFAIFQQAPERVTITPAEMKNDMHLFRCFIAEAKGGNIIGFASFFFAYYSWSGRAVYLDDLYVTDAFRKKGVGKKLLQ